MEVLIIEQFRRCFIEKVVRRAINNIMVGKKVLGM